MRGLDEDHVFTRGLGGPVFPDTVSQLMPRLIEAYDRTVMEPDRLPRARLHDLRHVHATTLLLAGVPVHVVAERLGHAGPAITLRVYAHVIRQRAADVADIFARELDSDGASDADSDGRDDDDPPAALPVPC
ncbi:site-specific integrase [Jiangella asiatica]|uniref:site-specific integrase n=1 Tax=Jiangella asiatica TaxID=2530372 RepID=UPI00193DDEAC|nr:site-specific integrase [Jiangella asiatica]